MYDVLVILFVFLCFLVVPSDGGSVLAECVLLVRGPPPKASGFRLRAEISKNSKANRIETGERSGGIGEICSVEVEEK
jgi:hypothetical protein